MAYGLAVWAGFTTAAVVAAGEVRALLQARPWPVAPSELMLGGTLVLAGLFQFSRLKYHCLDKCRTPYGFIAGRWRGPHPWQSALRLGLDHGLYCVGCCWALMLLLFVGGVMNLAVIAALTAFVAFEKLSPFSHRTARVSGLLLVGSGTWMLAGL